MTAISKSLCRRSSYIYLLLFLFYCETGFAQQSAKELSYHPYVLPGITNEINRTVSTTGTIHIIAVMVDFQKDQNQYTSGNGQFNTSIVDTSSSSPFNPANVTIDPLPHNRAYFEAHLELAKNYFNKVSGGKLNIQYTVLPKVYHLNHSMSYYAPMGESDAQDYKLANLVGDSWKAVLQNGGYDTTGLDPNNTLFIIFHAGAGRDFNFLGTSLDHTPEDIPSLYLSKDALSKLLQNPTFSGFPINNNGFEVTNSIIMPETESRLGTDVSGDRYLLQFSINGLLCASIGSFLGLPDLYNTQTGASGIGRFGLMDPESFFSYLGLFPPEPSAWEKIFLGWDNSFEINLKDTQPISLPASSLHQPNSIARYNISSDEYFLVANRNRNPQNNGLTVTIQKPDGQTVSQHISDKDAYFNPQYPDSIEAKLTPGVVTNVSNFDWSLPGGAESDTGNTPRVLNGGILIWHIDNAVIRDKIASNSINNNPDRKGINLMEADGAQDIGKEALSVLLGDVTGGTPFDFWWKGNDASAITQNGDTLRLYQNRFAGDTHPNNRSNTGSPSFFEFYDFSQNLPVETFRAKPDNPDWFRSVTIAPAQKPSSTIQNTQNYIDGYPLGLKLFVSGSDSLLIIPTPTDVYSLKINRGISHDWYDFGFSEPQQPFIGKYLVLTHDENQYNGNGATEAWNYINGKWQMAWQNNQVPASYGFISSNNGDTLNFDFGKERLNINDGSSFPSLAHEQQSSRPLNGQVSIIENKTFKISGTNYVNSNWFQNSKPGQRLYTGSLNLDSQNAPAFFALDMNNLYLARPTQSSGVSVTTIEKSTSIGWPAFADYNNNGSLDFIFVDKTGNRIVAKNSDGAVLNGFPISAPAGSHFVGTPLIADLDGNGKPDLVVGAQDSVSYTLHAYNQNQQELPSFPLYVGSINSNDFEPVHPIFVNKTLYAVSPQGDIRAWHFPKSGKSEWDSQYGNGKFNKIYSQAQVTGTQVVNFGILNKKETYNWPNPANNETYVRYQTKGPGTVQIMIITMTGRTLFDRSVDAKGGVPEETRINTQSWGNGVYYARVRATINGKSESKLIKIAVIH